MRNCRRGFALVTVLLVTAVMVILVTAMIGAAQGESMLTRNYSDRVRASYAAEAGVAHALEMLNDRGWTDGFDEEPMADGRSHYSLTFAAGESVNNLLGAGEVDGAAAGTARLRVIGVSGLQRQQVEVIVRSGGFPDLDVPMMADGNIELAGSVEVSGIEALDAPLAVEAGLHSNKSSGSGDVISWDGSGQAIVSGTVSLSRSSGVNMAGAQLLGSPAQLTDAPTKAFPPIDVSASVDAKSGATGAVIPSTGTAVLGAGVPEDLYVSGDVEIHGDLVLDGATLYVDGNLLVNGTIKGEGGVYVDGTTTFKGDSEITSNNDQKIAVYSQGDVSLSGYDGSAELAALAAGDPILDALWSDTRGALQDLQRLVDANLTTPANLQGPGAHGDYLAAVPQDYVLADRLRANLGQGGRNATNAMYYNANYEVDLFGRMAQHLLNNQPAGASRDFLVQRFQGLERFFNGFETDVNGNLTGLNALDVVTAWRNGTPFQGGIFDALMKSNSGATPTPEEMAQMLTIVDQTDYQRLGSSYFQGLVYTGGSLLASNEVSVVGAVLARGDIELRTGSRVTFVQEYFDGSNPGSSGGRPRVITWLVR